MTTALDQGANAATRREEGRPHRQTTRVPEAGRTHEGRRRLDLRHHERRRRQVGAERDRRASARRGLREAVQPRDAARLGHRAWHAGCATSSMMSSQSTRMPAGVDDADVLAMAVREDRILITNCMRASTSSASVTSATGSRAKRIRHPASL
ncbi:hypothetical protein [Sorangium sp. So ce887]|uniref:hypothetical protein n=1 Tax=Sorangium sp. So ce887 TaxID=3133324 RepID=UPI003F6433DD